HFIQAGQSAKKTFTAALKPVEYHELLNKYEIFFLKNSKIFVRYFRKHGRYSTPHLTALPASMGCASTMLELARHCIRLAPLVPCQGRGTLPPPAPPSKP
ncbi:MAG: hypothetical protein IJ160_02375, partial [Muribaculaceae bacterium]|nr:hypothetical protein [Muribaculaceae bacterium]